MIHSPFNCCVASVDKALIHRIREDEEVHVGVLDYIQRQAWSVKLTNAGLCEAGAQLTENGWPWAMLECCCRTPSFTCFNCSDAAPSYRPVGARGPTSQICA